MLITPAATAYLLTDRMKRMLIYASLLGMGAGALGSFLSFLESNLPTGPLMVLAASFIFALVFLIAPRHGLLIRAWRRRYRSQRVDVENTLKALFHVLEDRNFHGEGITVKEFAERRRQTLEEAQRSLWLLKKQNFLTFHDEGLTVLLTPQGWEGACSMVRNHRLWELYLTHAAQIAPDHVHDEAEKIEHVLGEEIVQQLEKRLKYATRDPHGKLIPSTADIRRGIPSLLPTERVTGYGRGSP
jgi:manganese/zinc/iron transport system permease protein